MTRNKTKTFKYFSAFSGIGGFEVGVQQAYGTMGQLQQKVQQTASCRNAESKRSRSQCIGFSEIDKYAIQIYRSHFPTHKNYGDITKIKAEELPDFEFFCGGFPCQSFSIAGKRAGFNDTRGTLFFDLARIAKEKRPKYLLFENVKGLLSHDRGRTFKTILSALTELGYNLQAMVLNSKNFGVPQNRERVFIVGNLGTAARPEVFPFTGKNQDDNEAAAANAIDANYFKGADNHGQRTQIAHTPALRASDAKRGDNQTLVVEDFYPGRIRTFSKAPTLRSGRAGIKIGTLRSYKHGRGFREIKQGISPTLPARARNDGTGSPVLYHKLAVRRLTPVECERLQGFPDGWTGNVSDTQRYKTLGNAVTVNVIREIIKRIKHYV